MRNLAAIVIACLLAAALGAGAVWPFAHREQPLPDPPALVVKVRQVARLQSLDVALYKKVTLAPDPREPVPICAGQPHGASSWPLTQPRSALLYAEDHRS